MSAMSRFGPSVAKSLMIQQQRNMAAAVSSPSDPIQRLFIEKIRDFKTSSKGLDEKHKRMMADEMSRLKRVFQVEDENKLARFDGKYPSETQVSLHDLDSSKELRQRVYSGEHQKQLVAKTKPKSALLESIPYREPDEFHLPLINKPNKMLIMDQNISPKVPPPTLGEPVPDHELTEDRVTPESLQRQMRVVFGEKMPTIDDDKDPQRDVVNFPRQHMLVDTPPTVAHIIPGSWFKFFYPKTGVTGPYLFGTGFTTFLLSKEILVMEHELISGLSLILLFAWLIPKFGPTVSQYLRKEVDNYINEFENWQKGSIHTLDQLKGSFANELKKGALIDDLYNARKQDVDLQLEHEYRKRLQAIYEDTKRRLNYLVAVADSQRQIQQTHMVNWVISNVNSSIGPKQEDDYLNSCISNLRQLAQKNANAI